MEGLDAKVSPVPIKEQMQTDDGVGTEGYIRFLNDLRGGVHKIVTDVNAQRKAKAGQIFDFAGIEAPIGALPCNGQLLLIADYQELYDVIGFTWGGSGDSFNIPNQEVDGVGAFRRGLSAASVVGEFIDESVGTHNHHITIDLPSDWTGANSGHTHSYEVYEPFDGYVQQYIGGEPSFQIQNNTPTTRDVSEESEHTHPVDIDSYETDTDDNTGTETRPKAYVYLMCIWTGKAGSDDGIAVRAPRACEGDMCMATYDIDESGIVDDAEKVNGLTVETAVPLDAVFTDTLYDDTDVIKDADTNKPVTDLNKVATMEDIGAAGGGDMMKATYDQDDSGVVDNAELVNGMTVETAVPAGAVFTDTVYDDADVLKDADTNQAVTPTNLLATMDDIAGSGGGDMLRSVYDTDLSGVVDNSELVNGLTVETAVPTGALFTDTPYDDTEVLKDADANKPVSPTNLLATMEDIGDAGGGDMIKSVYDTDNSGVVDDSELANGLLVETAVPSGAVFTDTVYNDSDVVNHIANTNDPHSVTASQVGAVSKTGDTMTGNLSIRQDWGSFVLDNNSDLGWQIGLGTNGDLDFNQRTNGVGVGRKFQILKDSETLIVGAIGASSLNGSKIFTEGNTNTTVSEIAANYNSDTVNLGVGNMDNVTSSASTIAIGNDILANATLSCCNIGLGNAALHSLLPDSGDYDGADNGTRNIGIGGNAQYFTRYGKSNVSVGRNAGQGIGDGDNAVFLGTNAGAGHCPYWQGSIRGYDVSYYGIAYECTVVGLGANYPAKTSSITAIGTKALYGNKADWGNTAVGVDALKSVGNWTWFNGKKIVDISDKSGTYDQNSSTTIRITITSHGLDTGDIAQLKLKRGDSATGGSSDSEYGWDFVARPVTYVDSNNFNITSYVSYDTSGDALLIGYADISENGPLAEMNTAVGHDALTNLNNDNYNNAFGYQANVMPSSLTNTTAIGAFSHTVGDNLVQLGNTDCTTSVFGAVISRADRRDTAEERETILGLSFINKLTPIDFKWDYRSDYFELTEVEVEVENIGSPPTISRKRNRVSIPYDGTKKRSRYHHGFMAQDIQQIISDTGIDFAGLQDHGVGGGEDILSLGYAELIAPMVKAIQELSQRIEELENA